MTIEGLNQGQGAEGGIDNNSNQADFTAQGQGDGQGQGNEGNLQQGSDFAIPEEYQGKEWAKGFEGKSGDDLKTEIFKALDDKYSNVPDVPETSEGYAFNDILKDENGELQYEYPDEALDFFGDKFKELGLTKEQGQGILKQYTDFELEQFEKYTNAEELDQNVNAMFNGNVAQRRTVEGLIKEFLSPEDQEFLQKTTPNCTIEMFYKLAKGLTDKYGYQEGTSGGNKGNGSFRMSEAERDKEYNRIASEMEALDRRPHSSAEKENLQRQLDNLFRQ